MVCICSLISIILSLVNVVQLSSYDLYMYMYINVNYYVMDIF